MTFQKIETHVPKYVYADVRCDNCNCELKPVESDCVDEDGYWSNLQADDALVINLSGGYGMAIDPIGSDVNLTKIFCKDCVKKLCKEFPIFMEVVSHYGSCEIGHHCSKTKSFVLESLDKCCSIHCPICGSGSYYAESKNSIYDRTTIKCSECSFTGMVKFDWEV